MCTLWQHLSLFFSFLFFWKRVQVIVLLKKKKIYQYKNEIYNSFYSLCNYVNCICIFIFIYKYYFLKKLSKKCWVKYNPALGKMWTNPAIGLFRPSSWVTAQKTFNPTVGWKQPSMCSVQYLPSTGLYLTQHFLECEDGRWQNDLPFTNVAKKQVFTFIRMQT